MANPVISPLALRQAADWFARLNDEPLNPETLRQHLRLRVQWQQWLESNPANQQAWDKVEAIDSRLRSLDFAPAKAVLNTPETSRRRALKILTVAIVGLPLAGATGWHFFPSWRADIRTLRGEIRSLTLDDGTRLWLDTDTAVNVHYPANKRVIELLQGEIAVRTVADSRPLQVLTSHGIVEPLGTWFTVRENQRGIDVKLYEGQLALHPERGSRLLLEAGFQTRFDKHGVDAPRLLSYATPAWTQGLLIADGLYLKDLVQELGRYRRGSIAVSDEVANLRITGAFPIQNTDEVLAALEESLPVKVQRWTDWWIHIQSS